jgi:hypothetical protein
MALGWYPKIKGTKFLDDGHIWHDGTMETIVTVYDSKW